MISGCEIKKNIKILSENPEKRWKITWIEAEKAI